MSLQLYSPAKLNLMLHITGRRDDGYHLLETVFQFVELFDVIDFQLREDNVIDRGNSQTPVAEQKDILVKTAKLLQKRFNIDLGVNIRIRKQIPIGAGLGGGSSNAASCLIALNQLWQLKLSRQELAKIGLELGADVPIFIHGRSSWATGVGERLEHIELATPHYLIVHPGIAVSTAKIFNDEELTRNCDPITIRAFVNGTATNVCEPVVNRLYPEVLDATHWLRHHGKVRMSGTGSCIFVCFDSLRQAEVVKSQLPSQWTGFIAKGINHNPVYQQVGFGH